MFHVGCIRTDLAYASCFKTFEHRLVVVGKVVIEPFTYIEFDHEKHIDETDYFIRWIHSCF